MADKRIQDLTQATSVQLNDLFVLEQSGAAKSLSGQTLITDLATALSGHGGIASITYTPPVAPSLDGTLDITMADASTDSFTITNGNGIASIGIQYGISNNGTDPIYVLSWQNSPVAPTDQYPYGWTKITITDTTGNVTDAYSVTVKADDPSVTIGTVQASSGASASASITNSGTVHDPVLDFAFTLPKGDKGDTGDYVEPVVSYGTSTAAGTEPSTWYNSPSSISYTAGNFIWQKTEYTLHDAGTVQSTEKKIIGYIGQNGSGSGTVTQITFNNTVYADDGTGNVSMTIDAADVGAIEDPATKSNGQVLTYDSSAGAWVAANPTTGNVNTVNNVGVDAGTTNITLYATAIEMSSGDNTKVSAAIPTPATATPSNLGTAAVGSSTKYAKEDHVHNMPSNTDVGVDYKFYNSVTDLGLTSGSATISGAWSALSAGEILLCDAADFSNTEVPTTYGTAEIVKVSSSRGYIYFHGKEVDSGDYRMFLNSSNAPDGTWHKETVDQGTLAASAFSVTGVSGGTVTVNSAIRMGNIILLNYSVTTSGAPTSNNGLYCHQVDATVKLGGVLPTFGIGNGSLNNAWSLGTVTSSNVLRTRVFCLANTQVITIGTFAVLYF